jgi:hypothetical protein
MDDKRGDEKKGKERCCLTTTYEGKHEKARTRNTIIKAYNGMTQFGPGE